MPLGTRNLLIIKLLTEVGPLAVFFIGNAKFGIFYATAAFMGMIGLEFVGNVLNDWNGLSFVQDVTPQSLGGLVSVGWGYVEVALVLAKLYVALALYHFFWGILNTLFNWIKSPSLPFKSS